MKAQNIKLSELPETTTDDGVKVYGTTSYETQIAILSHYLHTFDGQQDLRARANRDEILTAIRDYIEYKRTTDKHNQLRWIFHPTILIICNARERTQILIPDTAGKNEKCDNVTM